jgi:hypothetical protein
MKLIGITVLALALAIAGLTYFFWPSGGLGAGGWEYARWGMNPEQVLRASAGKATASPKTQGEERNQTLVMTPTDISGVTFFVMFGFTDGNCRACNSCTSRVTARRGKRTFFNRHSMAGLVNRSETKGMNEELDKCGVTNAQVT